MDTVLGGLDLGFVVGAAFGAAIAVTSGYVVMRRWSLTDYERVIEVARYEAGHAAKRCVVAMLPERSERRTVDLKVGAALPIDERPTGVYSVDETSRVTPCTGRSATAPIRRSRRALAIEHEEDRSVDRNVREVVALQWTPKTTLDAAEAEQTLTAAAVDERP